MLASNKDEREGLLRILADAGVIAIEGRPSFFDSARPSEGQAPYPYRSEWGYPMCWWRGPGRLNEEAIAYWFGEL